MEKDRPAEPSRPGRARLSVRSLPGTRGTLLLLHGMGSSHAYFVRPLAGVGGFRLLLPDLLGHGESEKPEAAYTLGEHLAPLVDLVRAEGLPRPLVLGGHSMGAALSVALAEALPEGAVAGLLLLNLPWFDSASELHGVLRDGSGAYRRASEGIEVRRDEDILKVGSEALRAAGNALPAGLRDAGRSPTEAALRGTAFHLLFAFRLTLHRGPLGRVPTLALLGAEDRVAPPALALRGLKAHPTARSVTLPGAGHHLLHTHTDSARAEAGAFLSGL